MSSQPSRKEKIVVVGGGMVAHRFVERLVELDTTHRYQLELFGEEPHFPYDRVHLTSYLNDRNPAQLALSNPEFYLAGSPVARLNERVLSLDLEQKRLATSQGHYDYDQLVLATGSSPFVPPIPGITNARVFVYRTLDDLDAIAECARHAKSAAVIGGGLLGLEAAKALIDLGLETHVLEGAPRLMPRQLDARGAALLTRELNRLNVHVHVGVQIGAVSSAEDSLRIELGGQGQLHVDLLVVSAGIRPRDELARGAGIGCGERGGINVDDRLETSVTGVYAIGECASHRGMIYGLVAPGYAMADTLAARLTGDGSASFAGADLSTKLKLLGVEVASAGDPFAAEGVDQPTVVLDNFVSGVYQKLVLDAEGKRLLGAILVGDSAPFGRLLSLIRSGKTPDGSWESVLVPGNASAGGSNAAADDLVCTCNGVCHQTIVDVVRETDGPCTVDTIKKATRAGTGCGGCVPQLALVVKSELTRLGRATKTGICEHFNYTRQELFELVRIKGYQDFWTLIEHHGHGSGCELCKPVVASILASTHNAHILEHAHLQDTNDRFLANIQKRGLYSVVPRIPAGEITPRKLAVLADVAERYGLYTKITGGQRIDLFGAKLEDLPRIWEALIHAGFESGHAYGKSVRTVKSCVGSTWCRFGLNDSVGFAIRVENRYKGIRSPHKIKSAVSGCVRECAEAQSKDFGFIATESGWNLYVGGNGGVKPRHAELLASGLDDDAALRLADRFLMFYIRMADKLTRTSTWIAGLEGGIDHLRDVIVKDSLGIAADLERDLQALVDSYECEWARVVNTPSLRAEFERHGTLGEAKELVPMRDQSKPVPWPAGEAIAEKRHLPLLDQAYRPLLRASEVPRDTGVTVKVGRTPIAIFHSGLDDQYYASQARCPHKGDAVLGRGLLGDEAGVPKVACPLHKRNFSLVTGECLNAISAGILTFPVRIEAGMVCVELPPTEVLNAALDIDRACEGGCHSSIDAAE